jgi:hypothetical protein
MALGSDSVVAVAVAVAMATEEEVVWTTLPSHANAIPPGSAEELWVGSAS